MTLSSCRAVKYTPLKQLAPLISFIAPVKSALPALLKGVRIGIARDEALPTVEASGLSVVTLSCTWHSWRRMRRQSKPDYKLTIHFIIILSLVMMFSPKVYAVAYKWVDNSGRVHISDIPPADGNY